MKKMKRGIVVGLIALGLLIAANVLVACAESESPAAGEPAATVGATEGNWKHISRLNSYSVDMTCNGSTGIYVLGGGSRGLAVLDNDPLCK
jgi:hypothetical protein